ncbi:EcsC family protein [Ostreiculturibacter nitratireducens]|uniref:EcsC family protein n=1 Tax=Ostreiculturibacter nitratireducens TaxID=3075226 RepID=UPI0031B56680
MEEISPPLPVQRHEPLADAATLAALQALAVRHRAANGLGMQVLSVVGGSAENLLERLPDRVKDGLETATRAALERAFDAGLASRRTVRDHDDRVNSMVTAAMGAAGGFGGLPTALAELPVTVTVLLRAIQGIAAEHGFDPSHPQVRADCVRVFASAGPLEADDAAEVGFLAARVTITGQSLQALIARVAPRLAAVLGQKLAAQAAPVLGAVAGAGVNYVFTRYYQEMARVQFGLARLAEDTGTEREELASALRGLLAAHGKNR